MGNVMYLRQTFVHHLMTKVTKCDFLIKRTINNKRFCSIQPGSYLFQTLYRLIKLKKYIPTTLLCLRDQNGLTYEENIVNIWAFKAKYSLHTCNIKSINFRRDNDNIAIWKLEINKYQHSLEWTVTCKWIDVSSSLCYLQSVFCFKYLSRIGKHYNKGTW